MAKSITTATAQSPKKNPPPVIRNSLTQLPLVLNHINIFSEQLFGDAMTDHIYIYFLQTSAAAASLAYFCLHVPI